MQRVIKNSTEAYDFIWIDLPKGADKKYIVDILQDADYVICTINQEAILMDRAIKVYLESEFLKNKQKMLLIGNYEPRSKYNIPNIRRKYGIKDPILAIPTNYVFMDACNDGQIIDFMYKNIDANKNDYNGYFISEVRNVVKEVINKMKI